MDVQSWTSPAKFWEEVLAPAGDGTPSQWYRAAVGYWEQQEASNKGVLGGFDELSSVDIADSGAFIQKVWAWEAGQVGVGTVGKCSVGGVRLLAAGGATLPVQVSSWVGAWLSLLLAAWRGSQHAH